MLRTVPIAIAPPRFLMCVFPRPPLRHHCAILVGATLLAACGGSDDSDDDTSVVTNPTDATIATDAVDSSSGTDAPDGADTTIPPEVGDSADGTDAPDSEDAADTSEVAVGTGGVQVIVSSGAGWPVEGVTLSIGGETLGLTGVDGQAMLDDVAAGEQVVRVTAEGYAEAAKRVVVPADGSATVTFQLAAVDALFILDPGQDSTVNVDGLSVTVPAAAFVYADGSPVTTPIQLAVTTLDPKTEGGQAPGPTVAINADGSRGAVLRFFSMGDLTFTSAGEKVQLGAGKTATVGVAVDADQFDAGDEMDVYAYDLDAGGWRLDGTATVSDTGTGLVATFSAEHFTWRSFEDYGIPTGCFNVTVTLDGAPASGASVTLVRTDGDYPPSIFDETTGAAGTACVEGYARANGGQIQVKKYGIYDVALAGNVLDEGTCGGTCTPITIALTTPPPACLKYTVTGAVAGAKINFNTDDGRTGGAVVDPSGTGCLAIPSGVGMFVVAVNGASTSAIQDLTSRTAATCGGNGCAELMFNLAAPAPVPAAECGKNPDGVRCDDGNACTANETCRGGKCQGTPPVCSDGNVCTRDTCNPASGQCVSSAISGCNPDCETGAAATCKPACLKRGKALAEALAADLSNCVTAVCTEDPEPATCEANAKAGACAPQNEKCQGTCKKDTDCFDGSACTVDRCVDGACVTEAVPSCSRTCPEMLACYRSCLSLSPAEPGRTCASECKNGPDAADRRWFDAISNPFACIYNGPASCFLNALTTTLASAVKACEELDQCATSSACDDQNACTTDSCAARDCNYSASGQTGCANCRSAFDCAKTCFYATGEWFGCVEQCRTGLPAIDNDLLSQASSCVRSNNSSDMLPSLVIDALDTKCVTEINACRGLSCAELNCNDGNPCTNDPCTDGVCGAPTPKCDDGDPCTDDACNNGICSNTPKTCNDNNPCTNDTCNAAGACVFTNNTASCNDGKSCTTGDVCAGGACTGTPKTCNDNSVCTIDACDSGTGQCTNTPKCNDFDLCTTNTCDAVTGACSFPSNAARCDDGNPCTEDGCDSATGCEIFGPAEGPCASDNNPCTVDVCKSGSCDHVPITGTGCCQSESDCPDDGDDCTAAVCTNHTCGTTPVRGALCPCALDADCNDANQCTTETCQGTACAFAPSLDVGCSSAVACGEALQCFRRCLVDGFSDACDIQCATALPPAEYQKYQFLKLCVGMTCGAPLTTTCLDTALAGACSAQAAACPAPAPTCSPADCNDGDACTADTCHAGTCTNAPIAGCSVAGSPCGDAMDCIVDCLATGTGYSFCLEQCRGGLTPPEDQALFQVTLCVESPSVCTPAPSSECYATAIAAGGACFAPADICRNPECDFATQEVDCNDVPPDPCTEDVCEANQCAHHPVPTPECQGIGECSVALACTTNCIDGVTPALECGNLCSGVITQPEASLNYAGFMVCLETFCTGTPTPQCFAQALDQDCSTEASTCEFGP